MSQVTVLSTEHKSNTARRRNNRTRQPHLQNAVARVAMATLDRTFGNVPMEQTFSSKIILRSASLLSTSVLGVLATNISLDPSSSVGWAEVSTYYDEFRVVGAKLQIYSVAPNSITRISDIAMVVFDNDDATLLSGTGQAYAYSDKLILPSIFNNPRDGIVFAATRPVTKSSPIPWIDAGTPSSSLGAFKFYSETLDVSTAIYRVYYEYYLEVRGRR